jgi:hypothetical protein
MITGNLAYSKGYNAAFGTQVTTFMPELAEDASPELKQAWQMRMEANTSGLCPSCGATVKLNGNRKQRRSAKAQGKKLSGTIHHIDDCVVGDDRLRTLMERDAS